MRFQDKLVLVTGAASGIGLAIARRFLAEGATVIGTDLDESRLYSVAAESAGKFVTRVSDAGDTDEIASLADWIGGEYGRLDVLANNAGFARMADPESVVRPDYDSQMNVLLTGPIFYVKHLAGLLRASANGSVVNISSASALMSLPGYCPYGVAKGALVKFTEDSVVTVPGVRHNAVQPGFVDTPIVRNAYGDGTMNEVQSLLKTISPVPRMGTPADIAGAVAFLASDDASFITGACLLVDGGISQLSGIAVALSAAAR